MCVFWLAQSMHLLPWLNNHPSLRDQQRFGEATQTTGLTIWWEIVHMPHVAAKLAPLFRMVGTTEETTDISKLDVDRTRVGRTRSPPKALTASLCWHRFGGAVK